MPRFSRRSFLHLSAAASAAAVFPTLGEAQLAAAARPTAHAANAVMIDSNENPLGPCQSARDAVSAVIPQGGRYLFDRSRDLTTLFAQSQGLDPDWVSVTVGSTPPLALSVIAFTSSQRSYVAADPGYELGFFTAQNNGARVVNVPLTKTYAHDVKAMLAAAPDAGIFYICTPNNPTGTLTSHADIEYLAANRRSLPPLQRRSQLPRPCQRRQRCHRAAYLLQDLRSRRPALRFHHRPPRPPAKSHAARRIQSHAHHRRCRRHGQPER
jgi:hypothetical protein